MHSNHTHLGTYRRHLCRVQCGDQVSIIRMPLADLCNNCISPNSTNDSLIKFIGNLKHLCPDCHSPRASRFDSTFPIQVLLTSTYLCNLVESGNSCEQPAPQLVVGSKRFCL